MQEVGFFLFGSSVIVQSTPTPVDTVQWVQKVQSSLARVFEGVVGFSCVQWPPVLSKFSWQFSVL